MKFKVSYISIRAILFILMIMFSTGTARSQPENDAQLRKLQETIQHQKELIKDQSVKIEEQSEQIKKQWEVLESVQRQLEQLGKDTERARQAAEDAKTMTSGAGVEGEEKKERTVTSGEDRIKLAISGQINRMINIADDGVKTYAFYVDNDNSSSRVRFVGAGKLNEDLSVGAVMEVETESNSSNDVSQIDQDTGAVGFINRKTEAYFTSKTLGRLSIGKGSASSDGSSEVDLSGTTVVAYSGIAGLAGGMLFRDKDTGDLTDTQVKDVFVNFDGLGRVDRLRYDTPIFHGFTISGSAVEEEAWDAALRWGGEGYGVQAAGAFAVTDSSESEEGLLYSGSFSMLHLNTGMNLTAAGAIQEEEKSDDKSFWYIKGGWKTDFFKVGGTAFSIDYTQTYDMDQGSDEGWSFGAFAVQRIQDFGIELYGGFRLYDLDRVDDKLDQIMVGSIGTRVKF
jgi:hypothetical protein